MTAGGLAGTSPGTFPSREAAQPRWRKFGVPQAVAQHLQRLRPGLAVFLCNSVIIATGSPGEALSR